MVVATADVCAGAPSASHNVAPAVVPAAGSPKAPNPQTTVVPKLSRDALMLSAKGQAARQAAISKVKVWAMQLQKFDVATAKATNADMLVTDATSALVSGQPFTASEVASLKVKPDGSKRLLISYLSIGEAEDYRPDYFTSEYMEEDAPDWLLSENKVWKGNRLIRFCNEGWQQTILGDDKGMSVYNSVELSPLYKLIELGFDGVYLDRVDVYSEVQKDCPDAANKMIAFVERLAAHARKRNPNFIVIQQNAEELLQHKRMIDAIDAVAKEDLFYGVGHSQNANPRSMVDTILANLAFAKAAGRPVFVLDYLNDPEQRRIDRAKIEAQGFVPYIGPRPLDQLWLPGADGS
jgi:cysteinyl-tRNA synthetase, unknown class